MRPRDKNDNKLRNCYKSCLQKAPAYNVKSIALCCVATGIHGFDQKKGSEMALANERLWLESNYSFIDHVIFCTYENMNYEIYI